MCCSCEATLKLPLTNGINSRMKKKGSFVKLISKLNFVASFSCVVETINICTAENKT